MVAAPAPAAFAPAHVKVRVARPVEGCALEAVGAVAEQRGPRGRHHVSVAVVAFENSSRELRGARVPHRPRLRSGECRKKKVKALQCAICAKEAKGDKSAPEPATFCSPACFVAAWPAHKRTHKPPRERSASNASSDVCAPSAGTSKDLVESQTMLDDDKWESRWARMPSTYRVGGYRPDVYEWSV